MQQFLNMSVSPGILSISPWVFPVGIIFGLLSLLKTLNYGLCVDDTSRLKRKNEKVSWRSYISNCVGSGRNTPSIKVERFLTILIHGIATVLVGLLFNWPTAMLWSVLPTNVEQSVWLNGKRYMIAAITILCALNLGPIGSILIPAGLMFQWISVPAIAYSPWALCVVACVALSKKNRRMLTARFIQREKQGGITTGEASKTYPGRLIVSVKVFGFYFFKILAPMKVVFFYDFLDGYGLTLKKNKECYKLNKDFLVGILAIAIVVAGYFTPAKNGLIWYTIFISMWCHLFKHITQTVANRYTYIASMGLMAALVSVLPPYLATLLFGFYLAQLWNTMPAYKSVESFYQHNLTHEPTQPRARAQYANVLYLSGLKQEANRHTANGLMAKPDHFLLNVLMAKMMLDAGMLDEAEKLTGIAEENIIIGSPEAKENIDSLKESINKARSI